MEVVQKAKTLRHNYVLYMYRDTDGVVQWAQFTKLEVSCSSVMFLVPAWPFASKQGRCMQRVDKITDMFSHS